MAWDGKAREIESLYVDHTSDGALREGVNKSDGKRTSQILLLLFR